MDESQKSLERLEQRFKSLEDDLRRTVEKELTADFREALANARQASVDFNTYRESLRAQLKSHEDEARQQTDRIRQVGLQHKQEIENHFGQFKSRVNQSLKEVEQASANAKLAAGNEAYERHIRTFALLAKGHERTSVGWLVGAGVGIVILAVYLSRVSPLAGDAWTPAVIGRLATQLVIASALFGVIVFCLKNFRINQHLAAANHHRVTALATYKSFIGLAAEPKAADEILLEATRFVFAQIQTGYLGKDEETPLGQAVELARAFRGKE